MTGISSLPPRLIRGAGTGTSDSIPASIDGKQPAALSDGEYVIPAKAVAALGKGSTEHGAALLDEFVKRVYAGGGLVSLFRGM